MHHENHEVSRAGIDGCGSNDVRRCCDEWAITAPDDQGQRLIIQWTSSLRPSSGMTVQRPCSKQAKPSASHSSTAGLRD